jgi:hypothetical protein
VATALAKAARASISGTGDLRIRFLLNGFAVLDRCSCRRAPGLGVTTSSSTATSDPVSALLRIKIKFGAQNESPPGQRPSRAHNVALVPTQFTNTALPWSFTSDSPMAGFGSSYRSSIVADAPQSSDCASSSQHACRVKTTTTPPPYYPDHTRVKIVSKFPQVLPRVYSDKRTLCISGVTGTPFQPRPRLLHRGAARQFPYAGYYFVRAVG